MLQIHFTQWRKPLLLLAAILALQTPSLTSASEGDTDKAYTHCLYQCQNSCEDTSKSAATHKHQSPVHVIQTNELSYMERVCGWTCSTNCQYTCMKYNEKERAKRDKSRTKYYGKWPFWRLLGCQELLSTIFSILNAIPHIQYTFQYRQSVSSRYPYRNLWLIYSLVQINTWVWSAVFHTRDTILTERLDYFCASFGIVIASCCTTIRVLELTKLSHILAVFIPWVVAFVCHICYLQFVHFDYGWNMTVSLSSGIIYSAIWLIWAILHWDRGYVKKIVWCTIFLWLAAMLEIFDFPPVGHLLDAHALWHALTPPISYLFYSFLIDDANYDVLHGSTKKR